MTDDALRAALDTALKPHLAPKARRVVVDATLVALAAEPVAGAGEVEDFERRADAIRAMPALFAYEELVADMLAAIRAAAPALDAESYTRGHWDGLHCDADSGFGLLDECEHVGRIREPASRTEAQEAKP